MPEPSSEAGASTSSLTFAFEPLAVVLREPNLRDLIYEQWIELTHLPDLEPDIDVEAMLAAEAAGAYRAWIARDDGLMIGFIQWMFVRSFGYRGMLLAVDCGHFWEPLEREGRVFDILRMWREAEAALRALGVTLIRAHDNSKAPMDAFFARLSYRPAGTQYLKRL